MSCFIVSNKSLLKICEMVCVSVSFTNHAALPENDALLYALKYCFNEQHIFQKLFDMSYSAYKIRYQNAEIPSNSGKYICPNFVLPVKYENGITQVEPWHYEAVNLLDCYLYQCNEGNEIHKWALYLGIQDLRTSLLHFIVTNHAHYIAAAWE